ncbi:DUF1127 domain-containing protein [Palleronia aestuarii]|uniref:DUF1127 domain-containing protein n=1 Tax=Palleronia aestuarii TaxID=568105 RepID=UPI000DADBE3F
MELIKRPPPITETKSTSYSISGTYLPRIPVHFSLRATFARWSQLRRGRQALAYLGPEHLADIGVTREDARRETARPFWDDTSNHRT